MCSIVLLLSCLTEENQQMCSIVLLLSCLTEENQRMCSIVLLLSCLTEENQRMCSIVLLLSCLTEENQRMCSIVFPYALHLLQAGTEPYLLRPIASFIGLAVANNGKPCLPVRLALTPDWHGALLAPPHSFLHWPRCRQQW